MKKERRETVDEGEVPIMTGPPPVPSHVKQEQEHDQGNNNKKKFGLHLSSLHIISLVLELSLMVFIRFLRHKFSGLQ